MSGSFAASTSITSLKLGARQLELIADRTKIPELNTQNTERGHAIWDLEEYRGKIYIGMGDYNVNTGPIDIVYYDPSTKSFATPRPNAPAEATEYIRNINGYLFITMTDPQTYYGPAFVGLKPDSDKWITAGTIQTSAHYFDVTMFEGRIYVGTGDWTSAEAPFRVPSDQNARVYSSSDGGANWSVDLTTSSGRIYNLGSDNTTIFANSHYDSYVKQNGAWKKLNTYGNFYPITLNGTMRMLSQEIGGFYRLSDTAAVLEHSSDIPFTAAYIFQNNVSSPDKDLGVEVFWMIGVSKQDSTKREIWATTNFIDWAPIVTIADQGNNAATFNYFTRIAYYNNILYCSNPDGSLYAINGIFEFPNFSSSMKVEDITGAGGTTHNLIVTYTDNTGINVSTLDSNDIQVAGPDSFKQMATFVSVNNNTNGSPRVATYHINAPGGNWKRSDNGTYIVTLLGNQVRNTTGDYALQQVLGSFTVNIPVSSGSGTGIGWERYDGINGSTIADLIKNANYPDKPSDTGSIGAPNGVFQCVPNKDNYGTRMRGFFTAPLSGEYRFYLCADNVGELYLSTDETPSHKSRIASVDSWVPLNTWSTLASQKSSAITLVVGKRYYIEALQLEIDGGDHLQVGVELPGGILEQPIPYHRLDRWVGNMVNADFDKSKMVQNATGLELCGSKVLLRNSSSKAMQCIVYSLSGKTIRELSVAANSRAAYEIKDFVNAKGAYILSIKSADRILTKKIMVR